MTQRPLHRADGERPRRRAPRTRTDDPSRTISWFWRVIPAASRNTPIADAPTPERDPQDPERGPHVPLLATRVFLGRGAFFVSTFGGFVLVAVLDQDPVAVERRARGDGGQRPSHTTGASFLNSSGGSPWWTTETVFLPSVTANRHRGAAARRSNPVTTAPARRKRSVPWLFCARAPPRTPSGSTRRSPTSTNGSTMTATTATSAPADRDDVARPSCWVGGAAPVVERPDGRGGRHWSVSGGSVRSARRMRTARRAEVRGEDARRSASSPTMT